MKNKLSILFLAASVSANASSVDQLCMIEPASGLESAIANVSQFLSSSNITARHSVSEQSVVRERVSRLPELNTSSANKRHGSLSAPKVVFGEQAPASPIVPDITPVRPIPQNLQRTTIAPASQHGNSENTESTARLSPATEKLFGNIPNNIGDIKSKPQKITLNKESFVIPEFEDEIDFDEEGFEAIDEEEVFAEEDTKPKLDISVSSDKPITATHDLSGTALKALSVGQYESAISLYKQLVKRNPKSRDALFGLATAYHEAGERKKARKAYGDLLAQYPKFEDGINNFISLASKEAPEQALKELQELQKTNPKFSAIFAQKGLIYSKLGDTKQAIKNMAYALKINPNNTNYKYNLAIMLDEADKPGYAARLYKELVQASYEGKELPVGRNVLEDRLNYITAQQRL